MAPSPCAAADLLVSHVSATCDGSARSCSARGVTQQGRGPVAAGVKVAFYRGNPASGGTLLGVPPCRRCPAGGSAIATVVVASSPAGRHQVFAVVDDDGTGKGRDTECHEDNNSSSASGESHLHGDAANQPPVALCRDVTVNADAYCRARPA